MLPSVAPLSMQLRIALLLASANSVVSQTYSQEVHYFHVVSFFCHITGSFLMEINNIHSMRLPTASLATLTPRLLYHTTPICKITITKPCSTSLYSGIILSSVGETTYPIFIFNVDISFILNKAFHCVELAISSCNMQGGLLIERMKHFKRWYLQHSIRTST